MPKYTFLYFVLLTHVLFAQHQNIKISNTNSPEEPSICLNYLNTNYIVAGANINSCYYSDDAGFTWKRQTLESSYGVWGDPCIVSDNKGDFYFLHLSNPPDGSWIDRIVCQKSTNNGQNWTNGTFMKPVTTKAQDKEWASVDFSNNNIYVTWTLFDEYGTEDTTYYSNIVFSRSTDGGETWSEAIQINQYSGDCVDSDDTAEGAVPAVGPNGEIYVAWALHEKIYFDRSLDFGNTWLENDIEVASQPGGWDFAVPGIYRCNGLPVTCCDTSNSAYRGTVYVNWTDQRNGNDDTDVWIVKSTDGGYTWTDPIRVNNDNTNTHQFFTWMTIDQSNGYLYFVYYDRRNYTDNNTDVYLAISKDGGDSFENIKISEKPFNPRETVFFGDYNNITAYNNVVRPIWTRLHFNSEENGLSLWTAIINTDSSGVSISDQVIIDEDLVYPNPASKLSFYSFKLRHSTRVSLKLYDSYGRIVKSIYENTLLPTGKYINELNIENEKLRAGIYLYVLAYNKTSKVQKLIVSE